MEAMVSVNGKGKKAQLEEEGTALRHKRDSQ